MTAASRWLTVGCAFALAACFEVRQAPGPTPPASPSASAPAPPPASASAPAPPPPPAPKVGERVQIVEQAMGTRVVLAAYTTEAMGSQQIEGVLYEALGEIARIERLMTPWRDDSELSRVNAAAGKNPVVVGPDTFSVIQKSLWISAAAEGVFDITFASMGKLWRFDQGAVDEVPALAAVNAARRRIDYRKVVLDEAASSVMLKTADTVIDLGGIAKGYAIDRAAALLDRKGIDAYYAQAGGDLFVRGKKPDGTAWRVGIRDPRGPDGTFFARLPVEDHAFSTAGDYERAFIKGGKRYHHIIDPRTGFPATASRSVTVWARDALTADAIDDAVFILGPKKGLALVESIEDCGAVIVDRDNKVFISKRLEGLVEVSRPPSGGV